MGFMDKAKQAAEQAQKKLEETQQNFNAKQAGGAQQGGGQGAPVQYDKHGRPLADDAPPAATAPPPTAQPPTAGAPAAPPSPAGAPAPEPAPPTAGGAEAVPPGVAPAAVPPAPEADQVAEPQTEEPLKEGINQNPDPFKPIQ